jgi:YegS/Rv2252/BmrU family lipid kinase
VESLVLLNASAGRSRDGLARVTSALNLAGLKADIRQVKPAELTSIARQAVGQGVRLAIAAGGDGTVSAVAAGLAGTDATLGILPAGTLNHLARDLGIPPDLEQAARLLVSGQVHEIDVGQVNDRLFVNNCSIGIYPRLVIRREQQRHRLGRGKWLAILLAFFSLFRRYPLVRVQLNLDGRSERCTTPLVFVGNNRYEIDLLNLGCRQSLKQGDLSVYLVNAPNRLRLLRLVLRGLVGMQPKEKDFELICLKTLTIETRKRRLRVAIDGEVLRLRPPLVFQVRPRALRVLGP